MTENNLLSKDFRLLVQLEQVAPEVKNNTPRRNVVTASTVNHQFAHKRHLLSREIVCGLFCTHSDDC